MKRGRPIKYRISNGTYLRDYCKENGINCNCIYSYMLTYNYTPDEALAKWKQMKETGRGERLSSGERIVDFSKRCNITKSAFFYMRSARRWTTDETAEYYKNKYSKRLTNGN